MNNDNIARNNSISFFEEHAGFSFDPKTETREQGRHNTAVALANAENWALETGHEIVWDLDEDCPWPTFYATLINRARETVAWLGGVDFGRNGNPHYDPYSRVVFAELALEAQRRD